MLQHDNNNNNDNNRKSNLNLVFWRSLADHTHACKPCTTSCMLMFMHVDALSLYQFALYQLLKKYEEETTLSMSQTKSMSSLSAEMSSNFSFLNISSEMFSITLLVMKQPLLAQLTPRGDDGKKIKTIAWCIVRKESGKNQRTGKSWDRVSRGWQNSEIKFKVILCIDIIMVSIIKCQLKQGCEGPFISDRLHCLEVQKGVCNIKYGTHCRDNTQIID